MALLDLIDKNVLKIPLESAAKDDALRELVDIIRDAGLVDNGDAILEGLLERESLGSTGLDKGIAVPHTRTADVENLCVALGISPGGIDFSSLDGQPAHLFFLILSPLDQSSQHIKVLSEIARISRNEAVCSRLKNASSPDEVLDLLSGLSTDQ